MKLALLGALAVVLAAVAASQVLTILVIQPIGAIPDGRTVIMWRTDRTKFIDSADAICEREMGGVSLLCRGGVLAALVKTNGILLRLPFSETLYSISTGGKEYDR